MRLVIVIGATIVLLSTVLLGGARWIGQTTADDTFPLPDASGCWQDVCLFELTYSQMAAALDCYRDNTPGTACFPGFNTSTASSSRLRLEFAENRAGWARPEDRSLYSIHRIPQEPLLSLGALLTALGPPDGMTILPSYHVVMVYPARGLRVTVTPAAHGAQGRTRLQPGDPITALYVYNLGVLPLQYSGAFSWAGFGTYSVEQGKE